MTTRDMDSRKAAVGLALTFAAGSLMAAPTITSVVQKNGDTDRPEAKATGMTFDIQNPNGTVLVANYTVGTFQENAKAMTDRTHDYGPASATVGLPSYLVGREYVMTANNNRDNLTLTLDITISQPSLVYLLIDNRLGDGNNANPPDFTTRMQWVKTDLWIPMPLNGNRAGNAAFPDEVGVDESADGTINNWSSVYAKLIPAGTFTVREYGEGHNMYGVVVSPIPEPGVAGLALLGAGLLISMGRRSRR